MYSDTIISFSERSESKVALLKRNPLSFIMGSVMAGVYVGFGILLIFSVAAGVDPVWQRFIMGVSFTIALVLVVVAGAELFTGHVMYGTFGVLGKRIKKTEFLKILILCWMFNLLGALLLTAFFMTGGGGVLKGEGADLLIRIAQYKTESSAVTLFARAVLCNWLVCLALWMAARVSSDSARIMVIFLCLFAFIASGFEHSVANMTLLSLAWVVDQTGLVTFTGVMHNLFWVTLGNMAGGVLMAVMYWVYAMSDLKKADFT